MAKSWRMLWLLTSVVTCVGMVRPAMAEPILWGYTFDMAVYADAYQCLIEGCSGTSFPYYQDGSSTLAPSVTDSLNAFETGDFGAYASTTASITGADGKIGMYIETEGVGGSLSDLQSTRGGAFVSVTYADQLTFLSSTLPDGTPVSASGVLGLDFTSSPGCNDGQLLINNIRTFYSSSTGLNLTSDWCQGLDFTLFGYIGQPISFSMRLEGDLANSATAAYSGYIDASHTLSLVLMPDDPNVSYITASTNGFDGSTPAPVPEPASLTLLAIGLVATSRVIRRRRRSAIGSSGVTDCQLEGGAGSAGARGDS